MVKDVVNSTNSSDEGWSNCKCAEAYAIYRRIPMISRPVYHHFRIFRFPTDFNRRGWDFSQLHALLTWTTNECHSSICPGLIFMLHKIAFVYFVYVPFIDTSSYSIQIIIWLHIGLRAPLALHASIPTTSPPYSHRKMLSSHLNPSPPELVHDSKIPRIAASFRLSIEYRVQR